MRKNIHIILFVPNKPPSSFKVKFSTTAGLLKFNNRWTIYFDKHISSSRLTANS